MDTTGPLQNASNDGFDPRVLDAAASLLAEIERVITGQRPQLELVLATLLSGGHILLEDRPGVGKTVLAKSIGRALGLPVGRIQGTPDLLPTDITGVHVFQPDSAAWTFRPGPIFTSVLLVDELNRATRAHNPALLEAMAEGQVTADGTTMALPRPFMVLATQNPLGEVGTHPLGAAQLDRFATVVHLGLPGREAERDILHRVRGTTHLDDIQARVTPTQLAAILHTTANLPVRPAMVDYVLDVVDAFREVGNDIWLSVRVSETVLAVARGHALVHGRTYVAPEDVQAVVPAVLGHRLPRGVDQSMIPGVIGTVAVPVDAG